MRSADTQLTLQDIRSKNKSITTKYSDATSQYCNVETDSRFERSIPNQSDDSCPVFDCHSSGLIDCHFSGLRV